MSMFSHWDDDDCGSLDDGWDDSGWLFRDDDKRYPDGHPKSAYKDDGDMKLFKDD